jgi:hypothetical protein
MNEFSQDYEPDAAVEPPKKRRGWPKGQKRGPRAKGESAITKQLVKEYGQKKSTSVSNGAAPKTLTQLMFNVDRATALVLRAMSNAMSDEEKAFWSDWTTEEFDRLKSIQNEMVRNWLAAGAPHKASKRKW